MDNEIQNDELVQDDDANHLDAVPPIGFLSIKNPDELLICKNPAKNKETRNSTSNERRRATPTQYYQCNIANIPLSYWVLAKLTNDQDFKKELWHCYIGTSKNNHNRIVHANYSAFLGYSAN
nr:3356_t:CDS:2 [Entrophospora candida]